jgi:hypothetical protein
MVAVQCLFGIASELLPSSSASGLIVLSTLGCIVAATVGGFIAKRRFIAPAALVLLLDWALILYVLSNAAQPPKTYSALITATWLFILATVAAAILGAKVGEWLASKRNPPHESATT